ASHLTLSFAPDGTAVGAGRSGLFQFLNNQAAPTVWQQEILRALQSWAVNAPINIGVVGDSGAALGSTGAIQGHANFGDVRLAALPRSPGVLATAPPVGWSCGT